MTDKVELKSSHEVIYTVDVADVESIFYCKPTDPDILTVLMKDGKRLYCDEVCPIDSLQEEPVSCKPLIDIEIPFGARDSELLEESIAIPEGCYAVIECNRVVIKKGEEPVITNVDTEPIGIPASAVELANIPDKKEPNYSSMSEVYVAMTELEEKSKVFTEAHKGESTDEILADMKGKEKPSTEIDFEQELYNYFGQVKDFTLGMRIAKRFYDMGRKHQEPVSEELEEAAKHNTFKYVFDKNVKETLISELKYIGNNSFKDGAKWQKQQMAIDLPVWKKGGIAGGHWSGEAYVSQGRKPQLVYETMHIDVNELVKKLPKEDGI